MKYIAIMICVFFAACSVHSGSSMNDLCLIDTVRTDFLCRISYEKRGHFLQISLLNNTDKYLYLHNAQLLSRGLNVAVLTDNGLYVDCSHSFKSFVSDGSNIDFDYTKKKYNLNKELKTLSFQERDSIAAIIAKGSSNKHPFFRFNVVRLLEENIFFAPHQSYNECVYLPAESMNKSLIISYSYPYPFPVIQYGMSKEAIESAQKSRDSIRFDYPKQIKGYKLYDFPITSNTLLVDVE